MATLRENLAILLARGAALVTPIEGNELVIYGAGNCGRAAAKRAKACGLTVCAFLDARGEEISDIDGVACYAPESEDARKLARAGIPLVVAIFNFATDLRPIQRRLREIGFGRVLLYQEFFELLGGAPEFWLTRHEFYRGRVSEILAGFDLFEDEISRQIYHDCFVHRLSLDQEVLAQPDQANHYWPSDLPEASTPLRLVDGGAFTGDSLALFVGRGVGIEAVAAFEPDPENYRKLCSYVESSRGRLGEVAVIPCGLGEATEMRSFHSGGGAGSAIGTTGETKIQLVALDDILPTFAPTFIKLDIEGAEPLALRGAAKIIQRFHPRLAVCVYHAPEHLWMIPQLIHEMEPGYRLALRYHQWNGFDLVAYAFER